MAIDRGFVMQFENKQDTTFRGHFILNKTESRNGQSRTLSLSRLFPNRIPTPIAKPVQCSTITNVYQESNMCRSTANLSRKE